MLGEALSAVAVRGLRRVRWVGVMQEMATVARRKIVARRLARAGEAAARRRWEEVVAEGGLVAERLCRQEEQMVEDAAMHLGCAVQAGTEKVKTRRRAAKKGQRAWAAKRKKAAKDLDRGGSCGALLMEGGASDGGLTAEYQMWQTWLDGIERVRLAGTSGGSRHQVAGG